MEHNHTHDSHTEPPQRALKDFIPLIVIFSVIILLTIIRIVLAEDANTMLVMRTFMGIFFIVFGGFKVINLKGFVQAYAEYDILAKRSKVYGYLYPLIELALGIAYLIAFNPVFINWITLIIMLISAIGVAQKLAQKEEVPCACLGVVFKIPMTKVTLFEDLLMAAMALWMLLIL